MASSSSQREERPSLTPRTVSPDALRPFSRSPHPYHRKGSTKHPDHHQQRQPQKQPTRTPSERSLLSPHPPWSRTSSDSGTEADDESTGVLRGLPAPPIRPRKGLRAEDSSVPWLPLWSTLTKSTPRVSKDVAEKRVEVLRRLLEVALLVSVGVVVVRPEEVRELAWAWRKGMHTYNYTEKDGDV